MTLAQEIVWTALPNGVDGDGRPVVSALVSPRLRTDAAGAQLAPDFADFLDWPARVNAMTFSVSLDDGPPLPAHRTSSSADSHLWAALFRPATSLRPFEFRDFSDRNIWTFPVAGIMSYVNGLYEEMAKVSPGTSPPSGRSTARALRGRSVLCSRTWAGPPVTSGRPTARGTGTGSIGTTTKRTFSERQAN